MKLFFLSNSNSIHTKRWVTSIAKRGHTICLFTLERNLDNDYFEYDNIKLIEGSFKNKLNIDGQVNKLSLLKYYPKLKKAIHEFNPDIIHAHYATSYGLLGSLSRFKPYIMSVWGRDIFDFPKISALHRWMIKFNLSMADQILSTSNIMATETSKYTDKSILVTPFGIDITKFKRLEIIPETEKEVIVIGTVKTLLPKYGIDDLLRAFKIILSNNPERVFKLIVVGEGEDKENLIELSYKLGISDHVEFKGAVKNNDVPNILNQMDIYVALSVLDSESFGVAILEASACELPVVVTNVGGLPEVVENNITGIVVEPRNPTQAANAIEKIVLNKKLGRKMGSEGRKRVKKYYNWENNVEQMINIYSEILTEHEKA